MKIKLSILLILATLVMFSEVYAWGEKKTHPELTKLAINNSILNDKEFMSNLGFKKGLSELLRYDRLITIEKLIQDGSALEDMEGGVMKFLSLNERYMNHFHNPIKEWEEAGLDDPISMGESLILWAQDSSGQDEFIAGDQSWGRMRDLYQMALTPDTEETRQRSFAQLFVGLGCQMHLIQDAAVPEHVRNDQHGLQSISGKSRLGFPFFETWAEKNGPYIASMASDPIFPDVPFQSSNGLAPISQLVDTRPYDNSGYLPSAGVSQGLAEYTSSNFFSDDTIFAYEEEPYDSNHWFPYPRAESTDVLDFLSGRKLPEVVLSEDGVYECRFYIQKTEDGETVRHFLRPT